MHRDRCRAAAKLRYLLNEHRLFEWRRETTPPAIVDLAAAPGGFSQVALEHVRSSTGQQPVVIAVDQRRISPIPGVVSLQGSLDSAATKSRILKCLHHQPCTVKAVLHDGVRVVNQLSPLYGQANMVCSALRLTLHLFQSAKGLAPEDATFVTKLLVSPHSERVESLIAHFFGSVATVRIPDAVYDGSVPTAERFLAKRQPGAAASRRLHTALANKTDELPLVFLATVAGAPWPATAKLPDALRLNIRRRIVMGAADLDGVSVARLFIAWAKAPEHARDVKMFTLLGKLLTYHVNDVRNPLLLLGLLRAVERSGLQPPREFLELLGRRLTALSRPGALVEPALSAKSAFAALRTLHAVDALQGDTAHGLHKRIIIDLRCAVNVVVDARDSKTTATRQAYVTALEKSRTVPLPSMIAEEDAAFDETLAATLVEAKAVHGALKGKMPELTVKEAQRALSLAGLRVKDLPTLLGALRDTGARRGPGMVVTAIMAPFLASSSPAVLGQVAGIAAHMPATNEKFQSALIGRLIKSAPTCHPRDLLDGVKVLLQSHNTTKPCERVPDLVAAIQGRAKHAAPLELNVMLGCLRLITKMDPTAKAAAQIVVQETASRWEELMEKHLVPLPACRTFLRAAKKLELADDSASLKSKYDLVVGDEGGMEAYRRSSPSMLFGTLALNSAARFGATPSQEKRRLLAAFRHHFLRRRETHKLLKCLDCIECTYPGTLQSPIKALFCSVLLEQFDAAAAGRKALKVEDLAAFVESVKKAPEGIRMNRGVWTLLARMAKEAELADLTTECKALAKLC